MKKILVCMFVALFGVLSTTSCTHKTNTSTQRGSAGKTLEIVFVAEKSVYNGSTKNVIDSIFRRPQETFMVAEPLFDVVNIPPSSFHNNEMFQAHRNIIICDINPNNPNKVYQYADQWAAPQIVFEFAATDTATLDSLLIHYTPKMLQELYNTEHRRIIKTFTNMKNVEVMQKLKKNFGFSLTVSDEFMLSGMTQDFAWVRREAKDFSIGVIIQTIPFDNKNMFEQATVLNNMDSTMRRHIPGPTEGSYMGTERRWEFTHKTITLNGQFATETRGMWRTFGDFMGGPFVTYSILSPDKKNVIMLIAYTYSPRTTNSTPYAKRDHLMQVESVCHSISFEP